MKPLSRPSPVDPSHDQLRVLCAKQGFTYLEQSEMTQGGFYDLDKCRQPIAWMQRNSDGRIGVMKRVNFVQAAREAFASDLAAICGVQIPVPTILQGPTGFPFTYCFSPTDGGEPKTLNEMWLQLFIHPALPRSVRPTMPKIQGIDKEKLIKGVRACLSAYLPFAYLIGNHDFHDENLIISLHKDEKGRTKTNFYVCDHEHSKPETPDYPIAGLTYLWEGIFAKEPLRNLDADILTDTAKRIADIPADDLTAPIEAMATRRPGTFFHSSGKTEVKNALIERQAYIAEKFSSLENLTASAESEFKFPMTFTHKPKCAALTY